MRLSKKWQTARDIARAHTKQGTVSYMQSHRNYHPRIDSQLTLEDTRTMVESLNDGTYFIQIDPDTVVGPFAELHGDPANSDKIAQKLEQLSRDSVSAN
jgi:hypothetical protein